MATPSAFVVRLPSISAATRRSRHAEGPIAGDPSARAAASSDAPAPAPFGATLACAAVVALEAFGTLLLWLPIPIAWMWVGARVYDVTGSVAADGGVVFFGFAATTVAVLSALARLDGVWVSMRRRTGHEQVEGALSQVVIISATLGILVFLFWFYVLSDAYILPFMPSK